MSNKKPLPPYLENLRNLIAEDHNRFITEVTTMDWNEINNRPSPKEWSVLEIVDHVRLAEARMGSFIEALVEKGTEQGLLLTDEPSQEYLAALTWNFSLPPDKVRCPEHLEPHPLHDMATLLQELSQTRQQNLELLPRMTPLNLLAITRAHPLFGDLHLYHWVRFLGLHQARHLEQIRRIRHSLGTNPSAS